jgi:hypothetical protein
MWHELVDVAAADAAAHAARAIADVDLHAPAARLHLPAGL